MSTPVRIIRTESTQAGFDALIDIIKHTTLLLDVPFTVYILHGNGRNIAYRHICPDYKELRNFINGLDDVIRKLVNDGVFKPDMKYTVNLCKDHENNNYIDIIY